MFRYGLPDTGDERFLASVLQTSTKAGDMAMRGETLVPDPTTGYTFSYQLIGSDGYLLAEIAMNVEEFTDDAGNTRQGLAVVWIKVLGATKLDPAANDPTTQKRRGIGTQLYEFAAEVACDLDLPLLSDSQRSHFSEAFWLKQTRKGRSVPIVGEGGRLFAEPFYQAWNNLFNATYEEALKTMSASDADDYATVAVSEWAARLPRPVREKYWETERYMLNACGSWRDLSGMRRKKR